ncbi:MAG TPA: YkgJ family cysteine cluster protein [Methanomassiliicoccales archaeon]|nr:YkgJ family cysteine cluster protein [Methanomassiliicoccales archaeon]
MRCRRCGRCCHETSMELAEEDVGRLEALGYDPADFVRVDGNGIARLCNLNGACFFLVEAERRCRVYPQRPAGCRIYPVNVDELGEVVLDEDCPRAGTITPSEKKRKGTELKRLIDRIDEEAARRLQQGGSRKGVRGSSAER